VHDVTKLSLGVLGNADLGLLSRNTS
jgi:hypothetical protein